VIRATEEEKLKQIENLNVIHKLNADTSSEALAKLQKVALNNGNVFDELMVCVKTCTLGQITDALFSVGGQYRRSM